MRKFAEVVPVDSPKSIDFAHSGTFSVSDTIT